MANFIYIFLCALYGAVTITIDIGIKDWQYWVMLGCVVGAYICGRCK